MKFLAFHAHARRFVFCLALALGFLQIGVSAQKPSDLWQPKTADEVPPHGARRIQPAKSLVYGLDRDVLKRTLDAAPLEFTAAARLKETVLTIPTPDGGFARFRVEESEVLAPEIAAQFPDWKYYQGYGIDDPTATARFDITSNGFRAQINQTGGTFLIDPFQTNDLGNYLVYSKADVAPSGAFHCLLDGAEKSRTELTEASRADDAAAPAFSTGAQIRVYRTAIATTGEYTAFFGGQTAAFAQVTTTVNRINGIYRRDLAVGLTLVSGTNLIYADAASDPYTNAVNSAQITANDTNIDTVLGADNYDIGHLLTTATPNGIAGLGVVCGSNKGAGASSQPSPSGDPFDVDYVAHEMGHQFNANHTFNATANCNNAPAAARMEAGSGVTIMGYAGICSSVSNMAGNSIDNFHTYSQTEVINFVATGAGATCGTVTTGAANSIPVIAPLTNFTIPFNTPFSLSASATDGDGDALVYSWEQFDAGASPSSYPASPDDDDATLAARPLLRPYLPTASGARTFPSLTYILNNSNNPPVTFAGTSPTGAVCRPGVTCITGEDLPSIARAMNFRVSVRDGKGGTADAGLIVNAVNTATPFRVRTGNAATNFIGGANRFIIWDVSGTNAAPISATSVRILLSIDGGLTFPTVLAASTANDGSEQVFIPNTPTAQARIKVEAVGNIFFDINDANITIGTTGAPAEISGNAVSITGESCQTPNNQPDPGETLTVSLPLVNTGGASSNNLTATLQATGGVAGPVTQSYGAVTADGVPVIRNFTFQVSPNQACGAPVTLTFAISDGATAFQNITVTFQTGTPVVSLSENFDSVTAPTLPNGWSSVQTVNSGISWVTTTTAPNSPPNAAFGNEPTTVNAAALVSPAVNVNSASAQIKFRNRYNLETGASVGYDGMVLEYSTNGGTSWTDVVAGGGTFTSGGYNSTISTADQSPIAGRRAWSGTSGGYIDSTVNLPASLNGQNVQFRWLLATDNGVAVAGGGAWVDDVQVLGGVTCSSGCAVSNACRIQRRNDFTGDGITDFSVFRPSNGIWYILANGSGAFSGAQFGAAGDRLVPADYDGDGKTDLAVYRSGTWYYTQSSDNAFRAVAFGAVGDIPVVGDYTGDGKADVAVYRPSNGVWYWLNSTGGALNAQQFGGDASDLPVVGDFDGDCRMDLAVRRTTSNNATQYFIQKSSGGSTSVVFGTTEMASAIGDYNGDGKSEVGVVYILNGSYFWYAINADTAALTVNAVQFGQTGDVVTAGDYTGDGATDISIWRPSNGVFYYRGVSSQTLSAQQFGAANDTPTARWYQQQLP